VAEWKPAPEVESIAESLIEEVDRHGDLAKARIEYVFIDKAPKSKGRQVWGRARKMTGLSAYLAAALRRNAFREPVPFFVVEISHDIWQGLDDRQRRALVDHELCHLWVDEDDDGELVLGTSGHDVEEFRGVISRHGLWNRSTEAFARGLSANVIAGIDELEDLANEPPTDGA
jgi:hypothetical protein